MLIKGLKLKKDETLFLHNSKKYSDSDDDASGS